MDEERGRLGRVGGLAIEALVAAGPRKSLEEYREDVGELCEDAAGYRCLGDACVFWICDGTSNSNTLPGHLNQPGFNSRILAHDLGQGFSSLCIDLGFTGQDPKVHLPKSLFEAVAAEWQGRLINYLANIESEGRLTALLNRMPQMGDGSYTMRWSSTLLGGVYNTGDRTLDILNVGDCGAVIAGETAQIVTPKDTCGIILATITPGAELTVDVSPIEVEVSWEHFEGVSGFIAFSDGVAKDLDALLTKLADRLSGGSAIDDVRAGLIASGPLTYDDRAMIIGRFLPCEEMGESESHTEGWLANALLSVRRAVGRKME